MRYIVSPVAGVTLAFGAASLAGQESHSAMQGDERRLAVSSGYFGNVYYT